MMKTQRRTRHEPAMQSHADQQQENVMQFEVGIANQFAIAKKSKKEKGRRLSHIEPGFLVAQERRLSFLPDACLD